ncbi:MAG: hypothetical protein OES47_10055 [Acidobacteriota bacterium]|nr:hypothetical protein [Acidobacteriota bacterium]
MVRTSGAAPANREAQLPARALELDPLIVAAAAEVDRSLLRWMLSLSPRARLEASTNATRALSRIRRGSL